MAGPLHGIKVVELPNIGPVQFAGMLLSDLGAEVLRVDRAASVATGQTVAGGNASPISVIDRGRRFKNAFFAFGHGHVGLTLGPITGKLIADLVSDRKPGIDLKPFAVDRF